MESTPFTAEMADAEYRAVCAELGQLYVQRIEAAAQLDAVDSALKQKREALFQVVARHRALAHNEALGVRKTPLKAVEEPSFGK